MPDRVKQAVFDMLAVRYDTPGALPALRVADLFAGSGSLGLEALSRGAAACWFFERDRDALSALRRNVDSLGAQTAATVVATDAWRAGPSAGDGGEFELMFLDPPYRDSRDLSAAGPVRQFLRRTARDAQAFPLIVFHHPADVTVEPAPDDAWSVADRRTFGTNGVTFLCR